MAYIISGAEMNLKVKCRKIVFLVVPLHFFGYKSTIIVVTVSAFVMVRTVWSVSCLLFFAHGAPPCPAICKSGGTCPRSPWSRRHCITAWYIYACVATYLQNCLRLWQQKAMKVERIPAASTQRRVAGRRRRLSLRPATASIGEPHWIRIVAARFSLNLSSSAIGSYAADQSRSPPANRVGGAGALTARSIRMAGRARTDRFPLCQSGRLYRR